MRGIYRFLAAAVLLTGLLIAQSAFAEDTFRGCLAGTKDDYILRSVDGNLYRLHSSDDIKHHVGEMVEVKGHMKNKDRDKDALRANRVNQEAGVTVPTVGIDVEHIKTVSGTCADMPGRTGVAVSTEPAGGVVSGVAVDSSHKYQHYIGCVSGTHDNYFLRADDGTTFRLHSDKDINEHVGRRVDVRGRIDNKERDRNAQATAAATGVSTEAAGLNVEDIKTIGGACSNTGASLSTAPETGVSSAVAAGVSGGVASGVASDDSAKYDHFAGCLTGTNGNYFLRADNGNLYRLHSDKDINEHVGDRVDVRGRIDNKQKDRDAQAVASATGAETEAAGINVEDIKSVSKGCINP